MHRSIVVLVAAVLAAKSLGAQVGAPVAMDHATEPSNQKEEVTVALFESFSKPGIAAVIRRTKGNSGRLLIGVKRSALSPELLRALFATVPSAAAKRQAKISQVDMYFADGRALPSVPPNERLSMQQAINELLSASPKEIPGYGKRPTIRRSL